MSTAERKKRRLLNLWHDEKLDMVGVAPQAASTMKLTYSACVIPMSMILCILAGTLLLAWRYSLALLSTLERVACGGIVTISKETIVLHSRRGLGLVCGGNKVELLATTGDLLASHAIARVAPDVASIAEPCM